MELTANTCQQARLSRDPRFDGLFFTGVKTTGIFCRPICSAIAPKEENVTYYPSAAAAMNAGFRPCLRCRPETAPQSAAWKGIESVAAKILRHINDGYLVDCSISDLAEKVGISERYLRDLCQRYAGASPSQLELARKSLLAKQLLFDSSLSIVDGGVEMDGYSVQPFYLYQSDHWYLNLSMGYQMMSFDMNRSIRYPSLNPDVASTDTSAVSDTDATGISSSGTIGYAFNPTAAASIEPYITLDYRNVDVDGYTEEDTQNDGFNFIVSDQNVDSFESAYGLKFQYIWTPSFGVFVPYIDMQYRIQHEDESRNIKAFYYNASQAIGNIQDTAFSLPTDDPDSSYQIYSFGVSTIIRGAQLSGESTVASGGLQAFANIRLFKNLAHYTQTQIAGGLRYEF